MARFAREIHEDNVLWATQAPRPVRNGWKPPGGARTVPAQPVTFCLFCRAGDCQECIKQGSKFCKCPHTDDAVWEEF